MWIKFTQDEPSGVYVRKSHNTLVPFQYFTVVTPRNIITGEIFSIFDFVPVYPEDLPTTKEKKKDLQDMVKYLKEDYHSFYLNLKTD